MEKQGLGDLMPSKCPKRKRRVHHFITCLSVSVNLGLREPRTWGKAGYQGNQMEMSANTLTMCAKPWGRGEREGSTLPCREVGLKRVFGAFYFFFPRWSLSALPLDYTTHSAPLNRSLAKMSKTRSSLGGREIGKFGLFRGTSATPHVLHAS